MAAMTLPKALRWMRKKTRPAFLAAGHLGPVQADMYKDIYKVLLAWWVISKLRRREHALSWLGAFGLFTMAEELPWNPFTEAASNFYHGSSPLGWTMGMINDVGDTTPTHLLMTS